MLIARIKLFSGELKEFVCFLLVNALNVRIVQY